MFIKRDINSGYYLLFLFLLASACGKKDDDNHGGIIPPPISPPVEKPYQMVWSDEFNVDGSPDSTKWGYDVGGNGWGNNELEYYTDARPENAKVENGHLVIEARK